MDPVTHLASGAVYGWLSRRWLVSPAVFALGMFSAWMPDVDALVPYGSAAEMVTARRGITHSLVVGLGMAAVVAWVFRLLARRRDPWWKLALTAYGGFLLHIWLDWPNAYGTQFLQPFSDARLAYNTLFIIEPGLTLSLLALVVAGCVRGAWRVRLGKVGVALALAWPLVGWLASAHVRRGVEAEVAAGGLEARAVRVLPEFGSPWAWKVVLETEAGIEVARATVAAPARLGERQVFARVPAELPAWIAADAKVATWVWFAGEPALTPGPLLADGTRALRLVDLRFVSVSPLFASVRTGEDAPPVVSMDVAPPAAGRPLRTAWHAPGAPPESLE
jgi:inner membrane protein